MKIENIKTYKDYYKTSFVDGLLSRHVHDDMVFDHYPISIIVEIEIQYEWLEAVYRKLWENVYIKNPFKTSRHGKDKLCINISLSEAIEYIYRATPPRLQSIIPENIESVDKVIECMKSLLMEKSIELPHYISILKDHLRFKRFNTIWNIDTSKVSYLREACNEDVLLQIIQSNSEFHDFFKGESENNGDVELLLHFKNYCEFKNVYNTIEELKLNVTNIMIENNECFVLTYSENFEMNDDIREMFLKSYKRLFQR